MLVEEPALLSKSRLRSDFIAHNVKLHLKHIDHRNAAEFSSDEEEDDQDEAVSSPTCVHVTMWCLKNRFCKVSVEEASNSPVLEKLS